MRIYAWPPGWTARFDPDLVVRAANGDIAAREGTRITERNIPGTLGLGCFNGESTSIAGYRPEE